MSRGPSGLSRCRRRPVGGRRRLFTRRSAYCLCRLHPAAGRGGLYRGTGRAGPAPPSGGAGSLGEGVRPAATGCGSRGSAGGGSPQAEGAVPPGWDHRGGGPGPGVVLRGVCPCLSLTVVPGAGKSCRSVYSLLCAACLRPVETGEDTDTQFHVLSVP